MLDYGAAYFTMRENDASRRQTAYRQEYRRVIQRVNEGTLLDVGCGTGEFADQFPVDRWKRYGYEPDRYAMAKAEGRHIFMVNNYHELTSEMFDLVIYRGVLQHIDEPFYSLRQAHRVLKPGGILAILAQPDADSLCYKLFHELPALDPPRNWWIPGRHELHNALINLGFHEIDFSWPYWGGPYAQPLSDLWGFIKRLFGAPVKFAFPGNMMEVYARRGNG